MANTTTQPTAAHHDHPSDEASDLGEAASQWFTSGMTKVSDHITIRRDHPDDEAAIVRLAALDSAAMPPSPFLLAEVDGELRAALSLANGRAIADPFHPSLYLIALLRVYAGTAEPGRLAVEY